MNGQIITIPEDYRKGCTHVGQLVYIWYYGTKYGLFHCQLVQGQLHSSNIRLFNDDKYVELPVDDSEDYVQWHNKDPYYAYFGNEDARIVELNDDIYIQFERTNPKQTYPLRGISLIRFQDAWSGIGKDHFLQPDRKSALGVFEKHWVTFTNESQLFAIRSFYPLLIGQVDPIDKPILSTSIIINQHYDCIPEPVHISSTGIKINDGYKDYLLTAFHLLNGPTLHEQYRPRFALMELSPTFKLIKVIDTPIVTNLTYHQYFYLNALSVKNTEHLEANIEDTLIAKGSVDNAHSFLAEINVRDLLQSKSTSCQPLSMGFTANMTPSDTTTILPWLFTISIALILYLIYKRHTPSNKSHSQ